MVKRLKRKKATRDLLDRTSRSRGAKEQMYAKLKQACIEALICREMDMLLTFPYFVKFKKGFPKGVLVSQTQTTNTYKAKTKKLLDWLHKEGHSEHDSEAIMKASRDFNWKLTRLENEIMGFVDNVVEAYVVSSDIDNSVGNVDSDVESKS